MTDIVAIIACALCGFALGKYFERRVRSKFMFCSDLCKYLALFKVNLDVRQLEIDKFNKDFCANCSEVFCEYIEKGKTRCSLNTREQNYVKTFFEGLNAVSTHELKKHVDYYEAIFADMNKEANDQARRASVYVKLGILLGVMVGIVLI